MLNRNNVDMCILTMGLSMKNINLQMEENYQNTLQDGTKTKRKLEWSLVSFTIWSTMTAEHQQICNFLSTRSSSQITQVSINIFASRNILLTFCILILLVLLTMEKKDGSRTLRGTLSLSVILTSLLKIRKLIWRKRLWTLQKNNFWLILVVKLKNKSSPLKAFMILLMVFKLTHWLRREKTCWFTFTGRPNFYFSLTNKCANSATR